MQIRIFSTAVQNEVIMQLKLFGNCQKLDVCVFVRHSVLEALLQPIQNGSRFRWVEVVVVCFVQLLLKHLIISIDLHFPQQTCNCVKKRPLCSIADELYTFL